MPFTTIKSILGKPKEDVSEILRIVFDNIDVFPPEEQDYFKYLFETANITGEVPSATFLLEKYPDVQIYLDAARTLNLQDVRTHIKLYLHQQEKLNAQAELNAIVVGIPDTGLNDEVFEKIRELKTSSTNDLPPFEFDWVESYLKQFEVDKHKPAGALVGIKEIDEGLGGCPYGSVTTVIGFAGSRKSTWLANIAYNNAVKNGYTVAYMSFELPKKSIRDGMLSLHSLDSKFGDVTLPAINIRSPMMMKPEQEEFFTQTLVPDFGTYKDKIIILDDNDFRSKDIDDIYETMIRIDDEAKRTQNNPNGGVDIWIWDHIQQFKFVDSLRFRRMDPSAIMNAYVNQIMKWSMNFRGRETIQFVAAQANRNGFAKANKKNGKYDMTDVAEVNEVERASTRIMSIFSTDELNTSEICKVQILKSRYGSGFGEPMDVETNGAHYYIGSLSEDISKTVSADDGFDFFSSTSDFNFDL